MVTFAREQVISVKRLSKRLDVSQDTIRRWFDRGLEHVKIGAKPFTSLEALDRFAGTRDSQTAIDASAELAEEMEIAKRRGM
jgi:DeoR/GlpR family transcriptional regulator of sugar metabolism